MRSLQLLSRRGVGIPVTAFANSPDDVKGLIREVGGAPLVIKLLEGTQGIGVVLAETRTAAESVIQGFMGLSANILVQEFIKEAGGSDIRCFVVGGKEATGKDIADLIVTFIENEARPKSDTYTRQGLTQRVRRRLR